MERYSLQLQTCKSISSPPWGETINWPQLVLIVAPVLIGKTQDGAHWWSNKKVFQCVLMLFPLSSMNSLFTWAFLLWWVTLWDSLRCGKAYVSSRLWVCWNVCHNFFNVCIGKAFTSVSFYVHLQVVSTKNGFMHISHAESLSPLSSNHVDLQTIPTLENFCTTPLFVSTSPEIRPLPSVSLHAHLQVVSIRKPFST